LIYKGYVHHHKTIVRHMSMNNVYVNLDFVWSIFQRQKKFKLKFNQLTFHNYKQSCRFYEHQWHHYIM